LYQVVTVH